MQITRGNLFDAKVEAIVNPVNCVGVMRRGLARQFKAQYLENYTPYKHACNAGEMQFGKMFIHAHSSLFSPTFIINFATKRHWRHDSRIEDIEAGLHDLPRVIKRHDIQSIAIPPLGCGLGGLSWGNHVRPLIALLTTTLHPTQIIRYEPWNEALG